MVALVGGMRADIRRRFAGRANERRNLDWLEYFDVVRVPKSRTCWN